MYLGSYVPSFSLISRRIALPKKIRDYLATSEVILSFGFEKCLFGFDVKTWQQEAERQLTSPLTEKRPRDLRRFIFASATSITLDFQGRFVIPAPYIKYAGITKPVVIGAGDHFEIWDEQLWNKEFAQLAKSSK